MSFTNQHQINSDIKIESYKDEKQLEGGKYLAFFKNEPNLDEYNPIYDNNGFDENGLTEIGLLIKTQKPYDQNNYEDYAIPRVMGMNYIMLFGSKKVLNELEYLPFQNFCQPLNVWSFPYLVLPWLNSFKFPSWINYPHFINNSIGSFMKTLDVAKENDFPKMREICSPYGYGDLIQIRDIFHTYKRIGYQAKVFSEHKIGTVDVKIEDNNIFVTVEYIFEVKYDIDLPKTENVRFPIRSKSDIETKSGINMYAFGVKWWSPIPESKKEEDLEWKFHGMC